MARSQTSLPSPGALVRNTTTYSITTRSPTTPTTSTTPTASTLFAYHTATPAIPPAFEPATAPLLVREAIEAITALEQPSPDKSRRFLSTTLHFSRNSPAGAGKGTLFTFTSAGSTLATVFNSLTLGLSAPLCRVYFVEVLFEDRILNFKSEAELISFLRDELGFCNNKSGGKTTATTTGEGLVRWLDAQVMYERRRFGFEKLQGNSFAVYLLTVPRVGGGEPDTVPLRVFAEKRYKVLDCVDTIVMLGGRFHNSVWSLFK